MHREAKWTQIEGNPVKEHLFSAYASTPPKKENSSGSLPAPQAPTGLRRRTALQHGIPLISANAVVCMPGRDRFELFQRTPPHSELCCWSVQIKDRICWRPHEQICRRSIAFDALLQSARREAYRAAISSRYRLLLPRLSGPGRSALNCLAPSSWATDLGFL